MTVIKGNFTKLDKAKNPIDVIKAVFSENLDPNRPFTGQPNSLAGERGNQLLYNIRMRDIQDLILKHIAHMCADDRNDNEITIDDIYKYDLNDIDPLGLVVEVCCDIERMMGIYPNLKNN